MANGKTAGNRLKDKLADKLADKLPGGFGNLLEDAIGFASDLSGQAKQRAQGELERLAQRLDLVTRREFEAVRAIAIAARAQAERLETQLNGGKRVSTTAAAKPAQSAVKTAKTAAKAPAKAVPAKKSTKPTVKSSAKPSAKTKAKPKRR